MYSGERVNDRDLYIKLFVIMKTFMIGLIEDY